MSCQDPHTTNAQWLRQLEAPRLLGPLIPRACVQMQPIPCHQANRKHDCKFCSSGTQCSKSMRAVAGRIRPGHGLVPSTIRCTGERERQALHAVVDSVWSARRWAGGWGLPDGITVCRQRLKRWEHCVGLQSTLSPLTPNMEECAVHSITGCFHPLLLSPLSCSSPLLHWVGPLGDHLPHCPNG